LGKSGAPIRLFPGKTYTWVQEHGEREDCFVKWNDETIRVNTADQRWEMKRLGIKVGFFFDFWKVDEKKAFCQLKPGETYDLKERPRNPFQARVSSRKAREPRFWLLLIINNVEYREDFKKENLLRELPAVVKKREGPLPFEIRDSENQRVRVKDLEDNRRYVIQREVEETINIVGIPEQIEVIVGNGRSTQRTIQERSGILRPILLTDEEGRRVPFSKVQPNATYRVMVDDTVWDQRTVQWGEQEKK
jgi:hypothetical protein